jgi:hypothetical protein
MVNQKYADLGIPNRFNLNPSRFSPFATAKRWRIKGFSAFHALTIP